MDHAYLHIDHIYLHMDHVYIHIGHIYLHMDHIYLHNRLLLILSKVYHLIQDRWKGKCTDEQLFLYNRIQYARQGCVVGIKNYHSTTGKRDYHQKAMKAIFILVGENKQPEALFGGQALISSWRKQQYHARRVKWEEPAST